MKASEILSKTKVKQCTGHYSCPDGGFCAYGVLMRHFGWKGEWTKTGRMRKGYLNGLNEIHQKVRELLGVKPYDDSVKWELIHNNDANYWSFKQIANWLKEKGL